MVCTTLSSAEMGLSGFKRSSIRWRPVGSQSSTSLTLPSKALRLALNSSIFFSFSSMSVKMESCSLRRPTWKRVKVEQAHSLQLPWDLLFMTLVIRDWIVFRVALQEHVTRILLSVGLFFTASFLAQIWKASTLWWLHSFTNKTSVCPRKSFLKSPEQMRTTFILRCKSGHRNS